jgi:hypothetical protein
MSSSLSTSFDSLLKVFCPTATPIVPLKFLLLIEKPPFLIRDDSSIKNLIPRRNEEGVELGGLGLDQFAKNTFSAVSRSIQFLSLSDKKSSLSLISVKEAE